MGKIAVRDASLGSFIGAIVSKIKKTLEEKKLKDPFGYEMKKFAVIAFFASAIAGVIVGKTLKALALSLSLGNMKKAILSGELTEERFVGDFKQRFTELYKEAQAQIIRQYGAEARDPEVMKAYMKGVDYNAIMNAHTVAELYRLTGDKTLMKVSKLFDEAKMHTKKMDCYFAEDIIGVGYRRSFADVKVYRDSVISEGVKKIVSKVKKVASSFPGQMTGKSMIAIGAGAALAALVARVSFAIISSIYSGRKTAKDILEGRLTEEQFVESYKKEYDKEFNELRAQIIREVGPEARDPEIMDGYLGDTYKQRAQIMNARSISQLYNITGEIKLKEIMKQFDKAKASNVRDSMNLMCQRMPGARYCAKMYGRKRSFSDAAHKAGLRFALRDSAMMRYDRMYRDGVLDIAKEKVKNAIAATKKFAKNNPRATAALSALLVALGTGSAIAISRAMKAAKAAADPNSVFESIGPQSGASVAPMSDKLKDAFKWSEKAQKSFDDKFSKFSTDKKKDTMYRMDRYFVDGVLDKAKEKIKNAIARVKQFGQNHPRLTKALASLLVAVSAGSVVGIVKAKKALANEVEYIEAEEKKDHGKGFNFNGSYRDLVKEVMNSANKAKDVLNEKKARVTGRGRIQPRPDDIIVDSMYGRLNSGMGRRVRDLSLSNAFNIGQGGTIVAVSFLSKVRPIQRSLDKLAEKLSIFATKHPRIAKIVRIITKILSIFNLIRGGINAIVFNTYLHNILILGKEGISETNKLFGMNVEQIYDLSSAEPTEERKKMFFLKGVLSALKILVSLVLKFVSKNLKPLPENAVMLEH